MAFYGSARQNSASIFRVTGSRMQNMRCMHGRPAALLPTSWVGGTAGELGGPGPIRDKYAYGGGEIIREKRTKNKEVHFLVLDAQGLALIWRLPLHTYLRLPSHTRIYTIYGIRAYFELPVQAHQQHLATYLSIYHHIYLIMALLTRTYLPLHTLPSSRALVFETYGLPYTCIHNHAPSCHFPIFPHSRTSG